MIKKNTRFLTGFTLTELLITITVMSLIIGVVYGAYILSQRAYLSGGVSAEILQNGRIVLERMSRELRQARGIVTDLPEERVNPSEEIIFQDGHLVTIFEEGFSRGGEAGTITLEISASTEDDYYEDMFVKIIGGTGAGQIRKIIDYNGTTKMATIGSNWETVPVVGSSYQIDSSYYYIRYFKDITDIRRQIIVYYFSGDSDTYVPWNAIPPGGQTLMSQTLEDQLIAEYITNLELWGLRPINIAATLEKDNKKIDLETTIFERNI